MVERPASSYPNDPATEKLITEALGGSRKAFNRLLDMHWGDVYRFLKAKGMEEEDVEDLTIETFAKAFEKLDTYNPQFRFKTWIMTIAGNSAIDLVRKNRQLLELFSKIKLNEDDEEPGDWGSDLLSPETVLINKQSLEGLTDTLSSMKPKYRMALSMRYIDELSLEEISEKLTVSEANLKVILMRARRLLWSRLSAR